MKFKIKDHNLSPKLKLFGKKIPELRLSPNITGFPIWLWLFHAKLSYYLLQHFVPKMLHVFFPKNIKFWPCKFSLSADPVILDPKLQLADKRKKNSVFEDDMVIKIMKKIRFGYDEAYVYKAI